NGATSRKARPPCRESQASGVTGFARLANSVASCASKAVAIQNNIASRTAMRWYMKFSTQSKRSVLSVKSESIGRKRQAVPTRVRGGEGQDLITQFSRWENWELDFWRGRRV